MVGGHYPAELVLLLLLAKVGRESPWAYYMCAVLLLLGSGDGGTTMGAGDGARCSKVAAQHPDYSPRDALNNMPGL